MPRNSSGRFAYIRADGGQDLAPAAAAAEPERRHRASSSCAGAGPDHDHEHDEQREEHGARAAQQRRTSAREPFSTAPQKKSVAPVPATPPVGTA